MLTRERRHAGQKEETCWPERGGMLTRKRRHAGQKEEACLEERRGMLTRKKSQKSNLLSERNTISYQEGSSGGS